MVETTITIPPGTIGSDREHDAVPDVKAHHDERMREIFAIAIGRLLSAEIQGSNDRRQPSSKTERSGQPNDVILTNDYTVNSVKSKRISQSGHAGSSELVAA